MKIMNHHHCCNSYSPRDPQVAPSDGADGTPFRPMETHLSRNGRLPGPHQDLTREVLALLPFNKSHVVLPSLEYSMRRWLGSITHCCDNKAGAVQEPSRIIGNISFTMYTENQIDFQSIWTSSCV